MSQELMIGLAVSSLTSILMPIALFVLFRRSLQLSGLAVVAGITVFVLMVTILEAALHYAVLVANPVTKSLLDAQPLLYATYGALAASLFEETGRYAAMRLLVTRVTRPSTPLAYTIGHGGTECVLVGINVGTIAVLGYLISTGQAQSLHLDATTQSKIMEMLSGASLQSGLMSGVERMSGFAIQLGFSYLVWTAVTTKRIGWWLTALAAHAAVDFPAALFQKKVLQLSTAEFEAAYVLLAVLVLSAVWAFSPRSDDALAHRP